MDRLTAEGRDQVLRTSIFSMRHTIESAQPLTFYGDYDQRSNRLRYATANNLIIVTFYGTTSKGRLLISARDVLKARADVSRRFRLDDDIRSMYDEIRTDRIIASAISKYRGMRVTLNDPWETTLCFIISQFNNIKRIRLITKKILERFGITIYDNNGMPIAKALPTSRVLAEATVKDLAGCGTGFRAKYIKEAADHCTNNLDLYAIGGLDYKSLKEELMKIKGIGDKVADCIALMGYGKLEAFPIDVWIKRTLERHYFKNRKKSIKELHRFAEERWGRYAGFAQQYLYHYGRNLGR